MNKHWLIYSCGFAVFLISYLILPLYIHGDLVDYNFVYQQIEGINPLLSFVTYKGLIGSSELIHFILIWVFSNLGLDRVIFLSGVNALLIVSFMYAGRRFRVPYTILLFIGILSFYFAVLYTELERLKVACVFLFFAFSIKNEKKRNFLLSLSILSHLQIAILFLGPIMAQFFKKIYRFFTTYKFSQKFLIPLIFGVFTISFLGDHIMKKTIHYFQGLDFVSLLKSFPLIVLSLLYSRNFKRSLIVLFPIIFAILIFSSNRLNILLYFVFLYYAFQKNRGTNFLILVTSIYFIWTGINFYINVIQTGRGYNF